MTVPQNDVRWRKSSRSHDQGDCVELANVGMVRDSKNPDGPRLSGNLATLATLVSAVKAGVLDS